MGPACSVAKCRVVVEQASNCPASISPMIALVLEYLEPEMVMGTKSMEAGMVFLEPNAVLRPRESYNSCYSLLLV